MLVGKISTLFLPSVLERVVLNNYSVLVFHRPSSDYDIETDCIVSGAREIGVNFS